MATIQDADAYVRAYCVDSDDWFDLPAERKQSLLNVAARDLPRFFAPRTIPDAAVCEFANALAVAYNDVGKFARQGVKSFNSAGTSFTFDSTGGDTRKLVPRACVDAINEESANAAYPKASTGRRVLPMGLR